MSTRFSIFALVELAEDCGEDVADDSLDGDEVVDEGDVGVGRLWRALLLAGFGGNGGAGGGGEQNVWPL